MNDEYQLEISKLGIMPKAKKKLGKVGNGKRFAAGKAKLMAKGKSAKNAAGIMAVAGMKKYGAKKMATMAAMGKKKK